ncbi:MAG: 2-dehydropantoate 2-reductase [Verrucomicrobia bacterium]|nr:2-dehydropantoate 2-reductase [Verrucomicrobiota bacterium]
MARIAIVGPGAIGGTVAARLHATGNHEVCLCARTPRPPLEVTTPDGMLRGPAQVVTNPDAASLVDWILVATKTYDAAGAAGWIGRLGAAGAPVAILQNGVEHLARFSPFVPADRLVPVVVDLPAERQAPDRIRQRGPGRMTVPNGIRGEEFARLFAGTGITVTLTEDFTTAAWRKLCLNAAGVVSALVLQPAGIMRDPAMADVARDLVQEAIAVGRAEGAVLPDELVDEVIESYRRAPPDAINSLHADRLAGRPTEIEARNGVIVRLGARHGIPTPANRMAVALLAVIDTSKS